MRRRPLPLREGEGKEGRRNRVEQESPSTFGRGEETFAHVGTARAGTALRRSDNAGSGPPAALNPTQPLIGRAAKSRLSDPL